jgi:hypothetical protein
MLCRFGLEPAAALHPAMGFRAGLVPFIQKSTSSPECSQRLQ